MERSDVLSSNSVINPHKKDYSDEELIDLLERGIERNVIVYDDTSINIERRLIYFMYGANEDDLHTVIIPTDVYPNFDFAGKMFGVGFLRDGRLNTGGAILGAYGASGGELPAGKSGLVIGVGQNSVVLGGV